MSPTSADAYRALSGAIRGLFPDVIVTPNLVTGATDSRYYTPIAWSTFRFVPLVLGREDLGRVHGTDERLAIENLARCVTFFARLLRDAA